jgi:hypothetical protein
MFNYRIKIRVLMIFLKIFYMLIVLVFVFVELFRQADLFFRNLIDILELIKFDFSTISMSRQI